MVTQRKAKTVAERQAERRAELEVWEQQAAADAQMRYEAQAEHRAFEQRVAARKQAEWAIAQKHWNMRPADRPMSPAELQAEHDAIAAEIAIALPWTQPPPLDDLYRQTLQAEQAAKAEAERQRIAALSPHDRFFSMLPYKSQQAIAKREESLGYEMDIEAMKFYAGA
jgi:hypothetical protein